MTTVAPRALASELQQTRSALLDLVEQRLTNFLTEQRAGWHGLNSRAAQPIDAISGLLASGGKRLRPLFCLSGYLAAGGTPADTTVADAAAALELLQAFALIHDDVVDNSPLRRGSPTVHVQHAHEHGSHGWQGESRRFGEGVAVLAGDLALAYADRQTAHFPEPARRVWDELKVEMIIGQHLDVAVAAEAVVDPALSRWIAVCKSGRYTIHRPLVLGATLAGRPDLASAFETYGLALGEAFQLRDDLIDAFGDSADTGKPTGLDFAEHKMTLLLALAVERDPRIRALLDRRDGAPWDADLIRDALESTGVRATVEESIAALVGKACASIAASGLDQEWVAEFSRLADQVAYRTQ